MRNCQITNSISHFSTQSISPTNFLRLQNSILLFVIGNIDEEISRHHDDDDDGECRTSIFILLDTYSDSSLPYKAESNIILVVSIERTMKFDDIASTPSSHHSSRLCSWGGKQTMGLTALLPIIPSVLAPDCPGWSNFLEPLPLLWNLKYDREKQASAPQ